MRIGIGTFWYMHSRFVPLHAELLVAVKARLIDERIHNISAMTFKDENYDIFLAHIFGSTKSRFKIFQRVFTHEFDGSVLTLLDC